MKVINKKHTKMSNEDVIIYKVIYGDETFEITDHLKERNIQVVLSRRDKAFKSNFIFSDSYWQIASFDTVKEAKKYIKDRKWL
mgnify:CR=1 FL=1